jgi:succinoglycan biosynthesis transport protein ExoP
MDINVATPAVTAPQSAGIGLARLAVTLRRHLALIGACVIAGAVVAVIYAAGLQKSYTASAALAVEGDRTGIPALRGALGADFRQDPMAWVQSEVQALQSRQLVQGVISELHVDRDPEFNVAGRPPTLLGMVRSAVSSLLPHSTGPATPGSADDALLGAVYRSLQITQDDRSLVIGIAFTAHDPVLAANFVNTLIHDHLAEREKRRTDANTGASSVVAAPIEQVRRDIDHIEQQMRDLSGRPDVVALRTANVGQQQVEDLLTAASRATTERSQIEAQWQRAAALGAAGSSDTLAKVLHSKTLARLRQRQLDASAKFADLVLRLGPNDPALRSAEDDFAATRRQVSAATRRIVEALATQLTVARTHEIDVLAQLELARRAVVQTQNVQAQLDQLAQNAAAMRDLYKTLLESEQQTQSQPHGASLPDVRLLSTAVAPGLPSAPNMKLAAGFGGIGGGLLGCLLALVRETGSGAPFDADALIRLARVSIIGSLNRNAATRLCLPDMVLASPQGSEAEVLRVARSRLRQIGRSAPRIVGFVGAPASAITAGAAAAFARVAAMDGQRVLLIDDCSASGLDRALGARAGRLGAVLAGDADWREAVLSDRVPSLDLLLQDGAGAQASGRDAVGLENLIAEARDEYDLIVMALGQVLEAARRSDVAILVIDAEATSQTVAAESVARLGAISRSLVAALVLSSNV